MSLARVHLNTEPLKYTWPRGKSKAWVYLKYYYNLEKKKYAQLRWEPFAAEINATI